MGKNISRIENNFTYLFQALVCHDLESLHLTYSLMGFLFNFYFLISSRSKMEQAPKWNVEYWKGESSTTVTCHRIYYISKCALILMTKILSGTKDSWKLSNLHGNNCKEDREWYLFQFALPRIIVWRQWL